MTSKDHILNAIRKQSAPKTDLPNLEGPWIEYANLKSQFVDSVAAVGGECRSVKNFQAVKSELDQLPVFQSAKKICSLVSEVVSGNVELNEIADPHDLEDVDFAIAAGEFGVAENGAVWVNSGTMQNRAVYFISQHLALVIPGNQLVHNMHQAYERLVFPEPGFGVFISGPSKTADIEQSLVIGAHGARSLVVFLVDEID